MEFKGRFEHVGKKKKVVRWEEEKEGKGRVENFVSDNSF